MEQRVILEQGAYPGNTATTILFYNHFQTFDFSWISVLDFGQLKSNWNTIAWLEKKYKQLLKNPTFYTEIQPFWNVF